MQRRAIPITQAVASPRRGIETVAVAQGTLDRGGGDVLGIRAVPDAVGDVGVDPPDQRLRVRQWVVVSHRLRLTPMFAGAGPEARADADAVKPLRPR